LEEKKRHVKIDRQDILVLPGSYSMEEKIPPSLPLLKGGVLSGK